MAVLERTVRAHARRPWAQAPWRRCAVGRPAHEQDPGRTPHALLVECVHPREPRSPTSGTGAIRADCLTAQVHGVGRGAGASRAARHPGLTASVPNGRELAIRAQYVTRAFVPLREL